MKSVIIFALLVSVALARPQNTNVQPANNRNPFLPQQFPGGNSGNNFFPSNNNQGNDNAIFATTTSSPNTPTTASPQFLACLQSCPSTMEYNPICGTDSLNYHNNGRLECARRCGKNVAALRAGTCLPL